MKTKNMLRRLCGLCFICALFASCSKSVPDYTKLIPEDAPIVVRIDARQISKKSGFGDNDKLKKKLEKAIKQGLSGKAKEKALEIIDNPAEAGLDLRDPVFIYANIDNQDYGIVGAVYKAEKFEELLNVLAKEAQMDKVKKDGETYYMKFNDVLMVTFTDDWFFIGPMNEEGDVKQMAKAIAKRYNSDKNALADNDGFKKFCEKEGLAQFYIQGKYVYNIAPDLFGTRVYYYYDEETIDEAPADEDNNPFDKVKDAFGIDINNFAGILDLSMDNGEASISAEIVALKEKDEKQLEEIDKMLGGEEEGFYFRFNFGFIDKMAKNLSGSQAEKAKIAAKLLKLVEMKYEGNCKVSVRLVTNEEDKTPLQSVVEIAQKEIGL